MIFLIPCGDRAADAIAICADKAAEACELLPSEVLARVTQVTRKNVAQCCGDWAGKLVCFWGHGDKGRKGRRDRLSTAEQGVALINSKGDWVIDIANVEQLTHTDGIFAVACHAARTLGQAAVQKKGLRFFMGFTARFYVVLEHDLTARYPLFSAPLKKYKSRRDWMELARDARRDLLQFVIEGVQLAGRENLRDTLELATDDTGRISQDLLDALPPATKDGVLQAFWGSQNLFNFKVIPEPPTPTAS